MKSRNPVNVRNRQATIAVNVLLGIKEVAKYEASNGTSIHTVSTDGEGGLQCTCQGFRIQKRGSCKHTNYYNLTRDRGIL